MVTEQPLETLEVDFEQPFAIWPSVLHNMQSLLSKWHFHSLEASLLLLPSFDVRSGLEVEEVEMEVFPLTSEKALESLESVGDVVEVFSDLEKGPAEGFTWWLILSLHSQ